MYEDFKFLNFNNTNHKIRKISDLINRLLADYEVKKSRINDLEARIIKINTEAIPTFVTVDLPDLTISDLTITLYSQYADFRLTVKNIGLIASVACILRVTIEDDIIELNIPALEIDSTAIFWATYSYDPSGSAVDYSVEGFADATNINEELNKDNNKETKFFTGKSSYLNTGIIFHAHIPEGKELGSIYIGSIAGYSGYHILNDEQGGSTLWPPPSKVGITEGALFSAKNIAEHAQVKYTHLTPGNYTAFFSFGNFHSINKNITVINNRVTEVIGTYTRTNLDYKIYQYSASVYWFHGIVLVIDSQFPSDDRVGYTQGIFGATIWGVTGGLVGEVPPEIPNAPPEGYQRIVYLCNSAEEGSTSTYLCAKMSRPNYFLWALTPINMISPVPSSGSFLYSPGTIFSFSHADIPRDLLGNAA